MVDELAVRTICPLAFSVVPVASRMRLGVEVLVHLATHGIFDDIQSIKSFYH
jgi:CHAT domain-containing protein